MISKRLVPTFESNSSAWWLQIKYNKLALQKKFLIQKNKKEEDYKPHDQPHNQYHYQKQKQ